MSRASRIERITNRSHDVASGPTSSDSPAVWGGRLLTACLGVLVIAVATAGQPPIAESGLPALLSLYDLTPESFAQISTAAEVRDEPALLTALEIIRRIPPAKKLDWQQDDICWAEVVERVDPWRAKLALVQGRVRRITASPVPKDAQQRLGTSDIFQCDVRLAGSEPLRAHLIALQVPRRLLEPNAKYAEMDQRFSATALIINVSATDGQEPTLLLVADRLAWHPDTENIELGVSTRHVWLANQGIDIAALDDVRDDTPLAANDRTSFYQLLAAAHRWNDKRLATGKPVSVDVTELLKDPASQRGRLVTLRGTARRAVTILVDDPNIQAVYGLNRFFEVEVFVESKMPIVVKSGELQRAFDRYPVVFCCRKLPKQMPRGEDILEPVEITGVYLKTWAYPSAWIVNQTGQTDRLQVSPLLIGNQPKWRASEPAPLSFLERFGGWMFVVALAGLAAFVTWTARGDRRAKRAFKIRFGKHEAGGLNQIHIEPPDDFLNE
jgi:hypothetical protein